MAATKVVVGYFVTLSIVQAQSEAPAPALLCPLCLSTSLPLLKYIYLTSRIHGSAACQAQAAVSIPR